MTSPQTLRRAAVFHHVWSVFAFDGPVKQLVDDAGGLNGTLVRMISREYLVSRTLPNLKHGSDRVAEKVNKLAINTQGKGLVETSEEAIKAACECRTGLIAVGGKKSIGAPLSAISKLLWFARKDSCWTIYDSYARRALKSRGAKGEAFTSFYLKLYQNGFDRTVEQISRTIADEKLGSLKLFPERLVDASLLLVGAPSSERRREMTSRAVAFQTILPDPLRDQVSQLADVLCTNDDCWLDIPELQKA